ncbi:MAG: hypothetical protein KF866_09570 [Phycisphaeraceae bacterium]|nr:hypothetical protein [Phycisphaeraceae bacterium]MCW5754746.1 hypothetical protein [Phycisphaeraceae bacterium]
MAYDEVGNLTDDGKDYEYVYDPFGRLRQVLKTSNQDLVAEYWYNPLGHRITWHFDSTQDGGGAPDGVVDADDPKFHFVYNERWQHVATFRQADGDPIDSDPKEIFLYHTAGLAGYGSSSYIDSVILRDDHDEVWTDEADATSIPPEGGKRSRRAFAQKLAPGALTCSPSHAGQWHMVVA